MVSKARQLAQSASAPDGRKNILFNGAMKVAQRATSTSSVTSFGYYACDRWQISMGNRDDAVFTISQNTSNIVDGFSNSFKVQTTTPESAIAANEFFVVRQKPEAQHLQHLAYATSSAKTTTLSFYVKSSVAATFAVYIYKPDSTTRIIGGTYTINSADTWEYKTITFAGDTDSGATINDDNGEGFHIAWALAVGSDYTSTDNTSWADYSTGNLAFGHAGNAVVTTTNATWEITGVQFEVGSVATEFEHRSFGEELASCQRYFIRFPSLSDASTTLYYNVGMIHSSTKSFHNINLPVPMRTQPDLSISGTDDFTSVDSGTVRNLTNLTIIGDDFIDNQVVTLQGTATFPNEDRPAALRGDGTSGGHFALDAEL